MTHPAAVTPNEFTDLPDHVTPTGPAVRPVVQRRWVTVTVGGHISGVFWGTAAPALVFLHDSGGSAREWDDVLLALHRPAVAVDLPGHGRSSSRTRTEHRPRRLATTLAEAVRSFSAPGTPVVGRGLGALAAVAVAAKAPGTTGQLVLVDTLPGLDGSPDDDTLWAQLAAAPAPLLVRTASGPLDAAAVERFHRDVPDGASEAVEDGPAPLAALLTRLLP